MAIPHSDVTRPTLSCIFEDSNPSSPAVDLPTSSTSSANCSPVAADIRRNVGLLHSQLMSVREADYNSNNTSCSSSSATPASAGELAKDGPLPDVTLHSKPEDAKPVISDVKLLPKQAHLNTLQRYRNDRFNRLSFAALDCLSTEHQLHAKKQVGRTASTFGHVTHQNVYIDVNQYQTLLRPIQVDDVTVDSAPAADAVLNADSAAAAAAAAAGTSAKATDGRDTGQCDSYASTVAPADQLDYGDETLRAIALITEKFDSFRRRQHRVKSFLQSRSISSSIRSRCNQNSSTKSTPSQRDDTANSKSSSLTNDAVGGGGVKWRSVSSRIALEHGIRVPSSFSSADQQEEGSAITAGQVTTAEIERARLFYSSVSTQVVVCQSLADVSLGACANKRQQQRDDTSSNGPGHMDSIAACSGWVHVVTGIPALVLNTGLVGWRQRRDLTLIVVDRLTGFPVWKDRVSYMSDYRQVAPSVHTMRVSGGLTKRVRLDIFDRFAADQFMSSYRQLTSDPDDPLWKLSDAEDGVKSRVRGNPNRNNNRPRGYNHLNPNGVASTAKLITGPADISRPCDPRWITRVDANDSNFRSTFAEFLISAVTPASEKATVAAEAVQRVGDDCRAADSDGDFRPRLPTN